MNRKQLLVILIVGLVLGGVGLYLQRQQSASFNRAEKTPEGRLLGDFPVNDVTQVTLRQNTNHVTLVKGDVWTVQERHDYPANAGQIIEFVRKLWDLRAAQSQKIGESQLGGLELLDADKGGTNSATVVDLKAKDGGLIRSVRLGKQSMRTGAESMGGGYPNGRWIYLPDKPGTAYLVSETFSGSEAKPEQWLKKELVRVEKPKSVEVVFPAATNSWKLTRETESSEWKLADAKPDEQLDAAKGSGISYAFSSPSFSDVLSGDALSVGGTNQPVTINITTFDNFDYLIRVGAKTNENYLLTVKVAAELPKERTPGKDEKPEEKAKLDQEFKDRQQKLEEKLKQEQSCQNWTYLVSTWTVDPLLKERSQLLADKAASHPEASTNGVSAAQDSRVEDPPFPASIHQAP